MASALHDAAADALELLKELRPSQAPDPDLDTLIGRLEEALADGAGEFTRAGDALASALSHITGGAT